MPLPQLKPYLTPKEYLALERQATYRSEYFDGEIFAMAGATEPHNQIVLNLAGKLYHQLKRRPCKAYVSDMRVKISATGLYTYPDVVAVCGTPRFEDAKTDTLLNPTVIIEVLSPSTATYDRGKKFENYRTLDSLKEYLLIAQDQCCLEHYVRQPNHQWLKLEFNQLQDTIDLSSIHCHLILRDVYDKTKILSEE